MTTAIRFLGAAREVTGSMHLLETSAGRILVDCGLFQGRRADANRRNRRLPDEALGADAAILTHAHIDHSGALPTLVRDGFRGAIWMTPATRDLAAYMLRDSARIQESDAAWLNRKFREQPGWETVEPIYREQDAIAALARMNAIPYHASFSPLPGVTANFLDAGHVLGSAQVVLDLPGGLRVVFSGDLGRRGMPILRAVEHPERPDYLVMESTYGDRVHRSVGELDGELQRVVVETAAKGGTLIVPAFSLERTQEFVFALHRLHRAGRIGVLPIFVDSPLAANLTEVFKMHPECYGEATRAFVEEVGDPFSFSSLRYLRTAEESMQLNDRREPAIVIAASGMCESGRVLHHLRNAVGDERNTILIVGFMAQHTLGRRLAERRPKVRIFGLEHELHARVVVLDGLSAHADRNDLLDYARRARGCRRIFLVHGEPEQQEPLRKTLDGEGIPTAVPARFDAVALD